MGLDSRNSSPIGHASEQSHYYNDMPSPDRSPTRRRSRTTSLSSNPRDADEKDRENLNQNLKLKLNLYQVTSNTYPHTAEEPTRAARQTLMRSSSVSPQRKAVPKANVIATHSLKNTNAAQEQATRHKRSHSSSHHLPTYRQKEKGGHGHRILSNTDLRDLKRQHSADQKKSRVIHVPPVMTKSSSELVQLSRRPSGGRGPILSLNETTSNYKVLAPLISQRRDQVIKLE